MEIEYLFLARAADVSPDGTLSVLGAGFNTLRSAAFPQAFPFCVVARLGGVVSDEMEILAEFDIVGPDGKSILDAPVNARMSPRLLPKKESVTANGTANVLINLGAILVPAPGEYQIRLRLSGRSVIDKTVRLVAEVVNG